MASVRWRTEANLRRRYLDRMINPTIDALLVQAVARFFLAFGIVAFAVGVGLIADHGRMRRFCGVLDRWVSMRRSTRWLAVPHDADTSMRRHRQLIGAVFVLVAAYSAAVLLVAVDADAVAAALQSQLPQPYVTWILESARRTLIVGSLLAMLVGIMLLFFPLALRSIESRANQWYSLRTYGRNNDTPHMGFDRLAETHPRLMGGTIAAAALVVVIDYGSRLLAAG